MNDWNKPEFPKTIWYDDLSDSDIIQSGPNRFRLIVGGEYIAKFENFDGAAAYYLSEFYEG